MSDERAYLLEHVTPLDVVCIEHGVQAGQYCNMLAGSCCARRQQYVTEGWQQIDYVELTDLCYYVSQEDENGEPIKTVGDYATIHEALEAFPNAIVGDSTLFDAPDVDPGLYGAAIRASQGLEFWSSKTLLVGWTLSRLSPSRHTFKVRDRFPNSDICDDCGHPRSKHSMTTKIRPSIQVQRNRGWSKPEDRIPVIGLSIPDLWGADTRLKAIGQATTDAIRAIKGDHDLADLDLDERMDKAEDALTREEMLRGPLSGERLGQQIMDTWALAHDLKRLVTETIEPAVDSALEKLRMLKDSMDTEGAPQKYELQAVIDILERVYKDGEAV